MATMKQRHKQELKQLNLECEQRLQGKKGQERTQELKIIEDLKKQMSEKQEKEVKEEEERSAAAAAEEEEDEDDKNASIEPTPAGPVNPMLLPPKQEKKPSKARIRQQKKEQKEEEERQIRLAEQAKRGPSTRDMEMKAITAILSRLGLTVAEIAPDGNCLYGAVAHQLKVKEGIVLSVPDLRIKAVAAMKEHPALFAPFLPVDETLEQHCKKVLQSGEWGGELEIRALAIALGKQIWIHRINSPTVKMGEDEGFDPSTALHLTFHEHQYALGEHYNSAAPVTSIKGSSDGF